MLARVLLLLILFQNIVLRYIPNPGGALSYWDEAGFLLLMVYWLASVIRNALKKEDGRFLLVTGLVILVGLMGNMRYGYQESVTAIGRDIVGFLKFPLTVLALYRLRISGRLARKLYLTFPGLKIIIMIMLVCGVTSLFMDIGMSQEEIRSGIHPFMFLYTHPTYSTTGAILILCMLNATDECTLYYESALAALVILAMRTKGLAFIAVYFFAKYGNRWLRRFRILYMGVFGILILAVSYSKLALYASYSDSPRESLYMGALQLLYECMPVGTGFGTYASHLSGNFFSGVYRHIHIAGMYNYDGTVSSVIGDAGLPYYLGQFGILGCVLTGWMIWKLCRLTTHKLTEANRLPVILIWTWIGISLTSEAILVNNGFELALFLVLTAKLSVIKQTGKCGGNVLIGRCKIYGT